MSVKIPGEFFLIDRISSIQEKLSKQCRMAKGSLGIGDDCAILPQREGYESVVSTDLLIEDVHFLFDKIKAGQLARKSLMVNLSDIAAMGGKPRACFLSIALPEKVDLEWMDEFCVAFIEECVRHDCPLVGGDTSSSKDRLVISVTVFGECPEGQALRRDGAKVGDIVCVTGKLGDSAAGLRYILGNLGMDEDAEYLIQRHYGPTAQIEKALKLRACRAVHSMMDISDGIASDLVHILKASYRKSHTCLAAQIDVSKLPLSDALLRSCEKNGWDAIELALSGGEDYELLFTMAPDSKPDVEYYVIGHIVESKISEIRWEGSDKDYSGFRHF